MTPWLERKLTQAEIDRINNELEEAALEGYFQ